jgi:predicted transcriptional regulator
MNIDSERLEAAGISQSNLAEMCKVTRAAVNHWYGGRAVGEKHQAKVSRILDLADKAVQAGLLPISKEVRQRERMKAIGQALVDASKLDATAEEASE